jgi:SAM-dependent methyltransferase
VSARAHGAKRTILVDAGAFATRDLAPYRALARLLTARGLPAPSLSDCAALEDVLCACNASYLPRGLRSLQSIEARSVDFVWSQAVLEHVRRSEFGETIGQMWRILAPGGVASHRVDLRDHLGGGLNNLRFSPALWESPSFAARSGFYTNRIQFSEMLDLFRKQGFDVEVTRTERWPSAPTPIATMHAGFREVPLTDLLVSGFDVLLRKRRDDVDDS